MVTSRITGFLSSITGPSNSIITEIRELENWYTARNKKFAEWYNLLAMTDELEQKNMESFVGNDPRTTWNMATFLLQPKPFIHTVTSTEGEVLPDETKDATVFIQQFFSRQWDKINESDLKRGKNTWFWNFIGLLIGTGWYAVPNMTNPDGKMVVDYYNPATIYPDFSDDPEEGLLRLARVRVVSATQAMRTIKREGWLPAGQMHGRIVEGHLWKKDEMGMILHGVIMGNKVVKPIEAVPGLFTIPIIVGATGGIPSFSNNAEDELANRGQSILATNASIYKNFNKQQTFMQQLLRDTANPRVKVTQMGNNPIIGHPDEWYARGAFFKVGPNEDIAVIPQPGIPVELTQMLFGLRNQMQRGGFSDLTFGNILQEVSAVLVTLSSEAAQQLITPFHNVVMFAVSEVTNGWYRTFIDNPGLRPDSWKELDLAGLEQTRIVSTYSIKIPGDLSNRINLAKALNPRLELPLDMVIEQFLPEIQNIVEAISKVESEKARAHPSYQSILLVQAMDRAALRVAEDAPEMAEMFRAVSSNIRSQLIQQPSKEDRVATTSPGSEAANIIPNPRLGGP